jgi:hypothetical protein
VPIVLSRQYMSCYYLLHRWGVGHDFFCTNIFYFVGHVFLVSCVNWRHFVLMESLTSLSFQMSLEFSLLLKNVYVGCLALCLRLCTFQKMIQMMITTMSPNLFIRL